MNGHKALLLALLLSVAPWVALLPACSKQSTWSVRNGSITPTLTDRDGLGRAAQGVRAGRGKVVTQSAPYSRAVGLVKRGEADA